MQSFTNSLSKDAFNFFAIILVIKPILFTTNSPSKATFEKIDDFPRRAFVNSLTLSHQHILVFFID